MKQKVIKEPIIGNTKAWPGNGSLLSSDKSSTTTGRAVKRGRKLLEFSLRKEAKTTMVGKGTVKDLLIEDDSDEPEHDGSIGGIVDIVEASIAVLFVHSPCGVRRRPHRFAPECGTQILQ